MSYTITCPICGKRDLHEFRFGNEEKGAPPEHEGLTLEKYMDYNYLFTNDGGVVEEWWFHRDGCGIWFKTHRDMSINREVKGPEGE